MIRLCFYPEYETSPLFNGGIPSILVQWYPTVSLDESSQDRTIYNIMLCEPTFARFVVTLLWNWSLRSTKTPSWGEMIKINGLYNFMLFAVLRRFERALFLHGPDLVSQGHRVALSFVKLGKTCLPTMSRYHWVAGSWIDTGFSMFLLRLGTKVKKFFEVVRGFVNQFVCQEILEILLGGNHLDNPLSGRS